MGCWMLWVIPLLNCYLSFVSAPPTTSGVVETPPPPPLTMENIAAIAGAGEPSLSQLFFRNTPYDYIHHSVFAAKSSLKIIYIYYYVTLTIHDYNGFPEP